MTLPPDFPWRAGMLAIRYSDGASGTVAATPDGCIEINGFNYCISLSDVRPDLTDPATLGALLGAVREAYPDWPVVCCIYRGSTETWQVVGRRLARRDRHDMATLGEGATEAAALLDAWSRRPGVAP